MRFLFVNPKMADPGEYYEFPLGIACVSASLRKSGTQVFYLNPCHDIRSVKEQLSESINTNNIDVVCTGGMSVHIRAIIDIVSGSNEINPEIITVVGGPIITATPDLAGKVIQFDFGVLGEGEITMTELARALTNQSDLSDVQGIMFKQKHLAKGSTAEPSSDIYIKTEPRSEISDLDAFPFPDYEGFGYSNHLDTIKPLSPSLQFSILDNPRSARIIASRSCPFSCTFCYHPLGKKYRQRSIDNVFEEIEYLIKEHQINILSFLDELFSIDEARINEFCKRLKPYNLKWAANLRVTDVNKDVLETMKDAGAFYVSYGIESMSADILESMRKKTTPKQISHALSLTKDSGLGIQGNLIFGDPEETDETVQETLSWWKSHKEYSIALSMIRAVPDSPIYRQAVERQIISNPEQSMRDAYPVINLSKLSDRAFKKLSNFVYWSGYGYAPDLLHLGEVIKSEATGTDSNAQRIFAITIRCPHCKCETRYGAMSQTNLFSFKGYIRVFCRSCFLLVAASSKEAFPDNYSLRQNTLTRFIIANSFDCISKHRTLFNITNYLREHFLKDRHIHHLMRWLGKRQ